MEFLMKKTLIFCLCAFLNIFLYANETKFDCAQLLNSYLEHDLTLQKLLLEVSKSELNLKLSKIEIVEYSDRFSYNIRNINASFNL